MLAPPDPSTPSLVLTLAEVAAILRVSERKARRLPIKPLPRARGERWLYSREVVLAFLRGEPSR